MVPNSRGAFAADDPIVCHVPINNYSIHNPHKPTNRMRANRQWTTHGGCVEATAHECKPKRRKWKLIELHSNEKKKVQLNILKPLFLALHSESCAEPDDCSPFTWSCFRYLRSASLQWFVFPFSYRCRREYESLWQTSLQAFRRTMVIFSDMNKIAMKSHRRYKASQCGFATGHIYAFVARVTEATSIRGTMGKANGHNSHVIMTRKGHIKTSDRAGGRRREREMILKEYVPVYNDEKGHLLPWIRHVHQSHNTHSAAKCLRYFPVFVAQPRPSARARSLRICLFVCVFLPVNLFSSMHNAFHFVILYEITYAKTFPKRTKQKKKE